MSTKATNNIVNFSDRQPEGREKLLERLFRDHVGALRGFLRLRMGVREDLDDVIQDVFHRLARIEDLEQKISVESRSCRSYLFAVANNLVLDLERRKVRQRRYAESQLARLSEEDEQSLDSPEALTLAMSEIAQLKVLILDMKPVWRDAFILTRLKSMSYKDAAAQMGIGPRQVERYLSSALKQIRKIALSDGSEDARK